jgi:protein-L-isoaspartate(D-aspartate) O-methyltransferase
MVEEQLRGRGIKDSRVLECFRLLPRERFVPADRQGEAYEDRPVTIGYEATLSQPYITAYMTERLSLTGGEKVLEVGTGSGFQTALLARLAHEVWSLEIEEDLSLRAGALLHALGFSNVHLKVGDGAEGWADEAPFDRILITCAVRSCPPRLKEQVRVGGWILAPVGGPDRQVLRQFLRLPGGFQETDWLPVMFVPARRPS